MMNIRLFRIAIFFLLSPFFLLLIFYAIAEDNWLRARNPNAGHPNLEGVELLLKGIIAGRYD